MGREGGRNALPDQPEVLLVMIPGCIHSLLIDVPVPFVKCQLDDILSVGMCVKHIQVRADELLELLYGDVKLERGREGEREGGREGGRKRGRRRSRRRKRRGREEMSSTRDTKKCRERKKQDLLVFVKSIFGYNIIIL